MDVTCRQCGARPIPEGNRYYCSKRCSNAAKRGVQVNSKSADYDDLEFLLRQGVEPFDALRRCGIPTADAAFQWAIRHGRHDLADLIREPYNDQKAAAKRARRRRVSA